MRRAYLRRMVFLFDSLCALILLVAAVLSWWMAEDTFPCARVNLRFAAGLLAAFAAARLAPEAGLAFGAALLVPSLAAAAAVLAICFPRRAHTWLSSFVLVVGLVAGLAAAFTGRPALALGYQAGAALAIFAWSFSRVGEMPRAAFPASLAGASLLLGAMSLMAGALSEASLFFAAFLPLVTRASQITVAELRGHGPARITRKPA